MILAPADRIRDYTAKGWWGSRTLADLAADHIAARPDAEALIDPPNRDALCGGAPRRLDWAGVDDLVGRFVAVLADHGVGRDDIVAVQLPNIAELVALYLATARLGAILMPFAVQYREYELAQLCAFTGPKVFVTATRLIDQPRAALVLSLRDRLPTLRAVLALGGAVPAGAVDLDAALAAASPRPGVATDANDIATLCFTSGTTGTPKGVPRSHNEWIAIAWSTVEGARLDASSRLLNPFPLVNMAGIGGMIVPWLMTGATLINHHPLDLPLFLQQIATERPDYTVAPPALLTMLLMNEALLARADLSSLKIVGSGAAPLPPPMVQGYHDRFGITINNMFGSNEGVCLLSGADDVADPTARARVFPRFGAGGFDWALRVAHSQRTRLVDPATGEDIAETARPGELLITGAMVFSGYWRNPDADAAAFDAQGWFRTGDLFEIANDDQGRPRYYRFVGRAKDLIIRGGMNIAPEEIEALIAGHPAVAEVAVVGYACPVMGERVRAVVAARGEARPTLGDIVDHLSKLGIAKFKLPERLDLIAALPRNPVGKVLKTELRKEG
jgi:acyl-CoA synthetase (AMP-forming)/AMP-acid ligase II